MGTKGNRGAERTGGQGEQGGRGTGEQGNQFQHVTYNVTKMWAYNGRTRHTRKNVHRILHLQLVFFFCAPVNLPKYDSCLPKYVGGLQATRSLGVEVQGI